MSSKLSAAPPPSPIFFQAYVYESKGYKFGNNFTPTSETIIIIMYKWSSNPFLHFIIFQNPWFKLITVTAPSNLTLLYKIVLNSSARLHEQTLRGIRAHTSGMLQIFKSCSMTYHPKYFIQPTSTLLWTIITLQNGEQTKATAAVSGTVLLWGNVCF